MKGMRYLFIERSRHVFCLTFVLSLAGGLIGPRHQSFGADVGPKIEVPAEGASMPMLDIGGRPVVEVKINGKGPFPFILDTGATDTVIDSGLSAELGSSLTEDQPIKELIIGAVKVTDLEAAVVPVTAMFGKVDKPPRGVLSALAFPGYLLTFDYPGKQIALRKGALPEANGRTIFSYGADEILPIVPVKVAGREVKVHLDTGAPFALALPTKYKDQLALTAPAVEKGKARTHAGDFPVFKGTLDGDIAIGDFKLASREVHFTDVVPHSGAAPQGQLGYGALREFVITLDSANRRIQFARQ
jgi:aspartyl protease